MKCCARLVLRSGVAGWYRSVVCKVAPQDGGCVLPRQGSARLPLHSGRCSSRRLSRTTITTTTTTTTTTMHSRSLQPQQQEEAQPRGWQQRWWWWWWQQQQQQQQQQPTAHSMMYNGCGGRHAQPWAWPYSRAPCLAQCEKRPGAGALAYWPCRHATTHQNRCCAAQVTHDACLELTAAMPFMAAGLCRTCRHRQAAR
jgi:hypothetical protein